MAMSNADFLKASPSASNALAVDLTSTDATFSTPARYLFVGVAGDVKVDLADSGSGITFRNVPVGMLLARVTKVYMTGTTAGSIVALW